MNAILFYNIKWISSNYHECNFILFRGQKRSICEKNSN